MDIGEIVGTGSVIAILLAIFGMGLVLIQRIDSRYDKLDSEIKIAGTRISDAEREQARQEGVNSLLNGRVETMAERISDAEREQARQEGVNSVLERLAHGHERGDQSAN